MADGLRIAIIGQSSTRWPVHGYGRLEGLTLAEDGVEGLMDAPVETEWIDDTEMGAVFSGERYLPRDLTLGFYFSDELAGSTLAGKLESDFRRDIGYRLDRWDPDPKPVTIEVYSELSGTRTLSVQMRETPAMKMPTDPYGKRIYDIAYEMRAAMPLFDSGAVTTVFESAETEASGTILVSNPTDMPMRHTWILTQGVWTISDVSWEGARGARAPGGDYADRTIELPEILSTDGGVRITRERRSLHATTFTGANFLGRMNGNWVRFDIPPYTPETELPISYTGAPDGGARAELYQPRLWSRPVGLELP
ncbi:MAG: hypothetical protein QM662_02420 [Gordonia sp. (in: high G+C Gram-positive bacteria)]